MAAPSSDRELPTLGGDGGARELSEPPARVWKRNERLVYAANFLHMTMYTMCLGGVFDIFLYNLSQDQKVLVDGPLSFGEGLPAPEPRRLDTFGAFELTFSLRPRPQVPYPSNSSCVEAYTCASSIIHVTDGSGNADCCRVGNRMPALFFVNGSTQLHLSMDAVGQSEKLDRRTYWKKQQCFSPGELALDRWTNVKVKATGSSQAKGQMADRSAGGALVLLVDGQKVCEVPGTRYHELPRRENAHVYFGSLQAPFADMHVPANVEIRDVKYGKPASNFFVGVVNSVQGILSVALMFPIGWIGDHMNRYGLLKVNVTVGAVAAVIMVAAVALKSVPLLFTGICMFTFYQQCISSMINAILADNVPKSERMRAGVNYKIVSALAQSFGPALQLLIILWGPGEDGWTSGIFDLMLLPGWCLLGAVGFACWSMTTVGMKISRIPSVDEVSAEETPAAGVGRQRLSQAWLDQPVLGTKRRGFVVAASVNAFFIFTLLANGMTVRYFNLYFTQILKFSPAQLCLLNAVCRLWIAGFVQLVKGLAPRVGRANLAVIFHLGSALFTCGIYGGQVFQPSVTFACVCYLLRFACLHARDPLLYSITMDCVPPSQRSRWAALNSLRTLSFSASAVLGGYLADMHGYEYSFNITVVALMCCTVIFVPVLVWFPRGEGASSAREPTIGDGLIGAQRAEAAAA